MFHKYEGSKYELMGFRGYALSLSIFFLFDINALLMLQVAQSRNSTHKHVMGPVVINESV